MEYSVWLQMFFNCYISLKVFIGRGHCGVIAVFHSGHGKLLKKIHAGKSLLNYICRFLNLDQCMELIKQEMNWLEGDSFAELYALLIDPEKIVHTLTNWDVRDLGIHRHVKNNLILSLNWSPDCQSIRRIVEDKCL